MYNSDTLEKFNKDKTLRYFPGSTIIQKFTDPEFMYLIKSVKDEYLNYSFSEKLVFVPEDSYHMTVAGLLVYKDISMNNWIGDIPEKRSTAEWDSYIVEQLEHGYTGLNLKMVVTGFNENKILLGPKTLKDREIINSYRKRVLEKIGIKFDSDYQFHITLNYTLIDLEDEGYIELKSLAEKLIKQYLPRFTSIEIDSPSLCLFNDMGTFYDFRSGEIKR